MAFVLVLLVAFMLALLMAFVFVVVLSLDNNRVLDFSDRMVVMWMIRYQRKVYF